MFYYSIGDVIQKYINHDEGTLFDISDEGATMIVFFKSPTDSEIEQFSSKRPYEIRFIQLNDVIMLTAKIGSLNWIDCPFTPHLSPYLTSIPFIADGQGLSLQLYLIDAIKGQIKHMRLFGLSSDFSNRLLNSILNLKNKAWNKQSYINNINNIMNKYSTTEIVKMSDCYCKF